MRNLTHCLPPPQNCSSVLPARPPAIPRPETWSHSGRFFFTNPVHIISGKVSHSCVCNIFHLSHCQSSDSQQSLPISSWRVCRGLLASVPTVRLADSPFTATRVVFLKNKTLCPPLPASTLNPLKASFCLQDKVQVALAGFGKVSMVCSCPAPFSFPKLLPYSKPCSSPKSLCPFTPFLCFYYPFCLESPPLPCLPGEHHSSFETQFKHCFL